ncbi:hypothetical protein PBI_BIGNUZ_43 [Mycobacterium phage BigNuz]|uniref:Uncharacterized protein n=2 Tax=Bignuzvirus bignuz TaxID=1983736 RepID=G1JX58_9CAUD|nr:hypothetical protein PBI_BIGNUZ_43 [Mycobacterium phage BigNuz]AEL98206.1 hypothetical protein PBI_BIGNUZ_43 [Mycobacterium phage BigNuz]AOT24883.1 hypothetical protein PBI_NAZO_44 [Mycobacterium phage Nazo]
MSITITRHAGPLDLVRIRACDERSTIAMALEVNLSQFGGDRYWQIAVIRSAPGLLEPVTYPRIDDERDAETWIRYLAELVLRAEQAEAVTQ